jgi:4-hydroxyphenylacetate 3-monooxygenase
MTAAQFHATPAHVYQNYQAQIRLMVKMRFLTGIARKIAETNGIIAFPQVRDVLGQLAAQCSMVEAFVYALEAKGHMVNGFYIPDASLLYAAQVLAQQNYNQFIGQLRNLAGGGLIMLPSGLEDFANPELRALIGKTQQSPTTDSEGRVKFFNLAWDAIGSEFASRHTQYEMFYSGATFVTQGHSFRTFDWGSATGLVNRMLDSYSLEAELDEIRH